MNLRQVLYVGLLNEGSSCIPRVNGLKALGLDVDTLDTTPVASSRFRYLNSLTVRTYLTPSAMALNAALIKKTALNAPSVVWIDKGTWVYPVTLWRLKKFTRFVIHHHTDDIHGKGSFFWMHRMGMGLYDLHMTTNRFNVLEMKKGGHENVFRVGMGYDQGHHLPPDEKPLPYRHEVVFIGHWERHTERYIVALRKAGLEVAVWGQNWRKASDSSLRRTIPLPHRDYVETIAGAKIALCFLSRRNRNESTGRSFEIPSIGTFLLAQRTAEHEYLFGDGVGGAFFTDEEELVQKARDYLANDGKRRLVAASGHARCATLGFSWGDHMRREWPLVERVLLDGRMPEEGTDDAPFWTGFRRGEPADPYLLNRKAASVARATTPDLGLPASER